MFSVSPTDIANAIPAFKSLSAGWQIVIAMSVAVAGGAAAGWFAARAWDGRLITILRTQLDGYLNRPGADSVTIGRRLEGIEDKMTDPQSKAALAELRREVENVRKPEIVYDSFDQRLLAWKSGDKYNYVHLWFRNESTGITARDAAARLSWFRPPGPANLFTVDGKWYEVANELGRRVQAENMIDLLPNNATHGLDLFISKPGEEWAYALSNASQIDERYRLIFGIYKVKVTISCEGYSKDFWFRVVTGATVSVREFVSPDGEGLEVKDEFHH